jgi:signal peptidase II
MIKGISIPFLNFKLEGMRYGQSIEVLGSFFKITFVENPGMAFGIDIGNYSKLFLSLFSIAASIGIVFYLYKIKNHALPFKIALALILGGAIGNLMDRTFYGLIYDYAPLFHGKVVDFFNVDFFDFTLFGHTYERWPIFNIADIAVTVGVIVLIFTQHTAAKKEKKAQTEVVETDPDEQWDPRDFRTAIDDEYAIENDPETNSEERKDVENNNGKANPN